MSDAAATTVRLQLYEPSVGPFTSVRQRISILDGRGRVVASKDVGPGLTTVALPLPPGSISNGTAAIRLRLGRSFVPKKYGLNGDVRTLAVVLKSAETR